jgi:hypothetical protein
MGDEPFITRIEPSDGKTGFSCGKHALDDYFARHAAANDAAEIGRARAAFATRAEARASQGLDSMDAVSAAPCRAATP